MYVTFIWINSNISETKAFLCKPKSDSELAISITEEFTNFSLIRQREVFFGRKLHFPLLQITIGIVICNTYKGQS